MLAEPEPGLLSFCFFCKNMSADRLIVKSKSRLVSALIVVCAIIALVFAGGYGLRKYILNKIHNNPSITMLADKWELYDYQAVYDTSSLLLEKKPFNNTILTYRGYASFYLAVSSTKPADAQAYIDEAVRCLRLSLIHAKKKTLPQIQYMLGKTYFYKNSFSSYHYYADCAVKYLTLAKEGGYEAADIPEYLGLSYAQLGMTMESIASFSEALLVRESDTLLLSIAEQYFKAKQFSAAKQYLFQIIQRSEDDSLVIKSRALLGKTLIEEKDYSGAQKEFEAILAKNDNSAEAHYGLGLVYEQRGDLVKARSEWRKSIRIQVNYADALEKIQQYK